ncbi:MAG: hypothetical protein PWQ37_2793 [Candidatus Petromonas sp.]|nr:hypothetical protein [Candidatus Petromonas sp.]
MSYNEKYFDIYINMYKKARNLEKENRTDEALKIYLEILKKYSPIGTAYYERPAIILEKKKKYKEALEVCESAIQAINSNRFNADPIKFEKRIERLNRKINISSQPKTNKIKKQSKKNEVSQYRNNSIQHDNVELPNWYICVSFGKSTSPNYSKAVYMAKMAPKYLYDEVDSKPIHQAFFSADPNEYLAFIALYELVKDWKSSFVIINGNIVDRKIIGKLNYCYGDKCRSGNPRFCYGASDFTDNPFGCHRAQMHAYNDPWYSYGQIDNNGIFHVNKEIIKHEFIERVKPYRMCPSLNLDDILSNIEKLPNTINPRTDKNWQYRTYLRNGLQVQGVEPKDFGLVGKIEISLDDILNKSTDSDSQNKNSGCNYTQNENVSYIATNNKDTPPQNKGKLIRFILGTIFSLLIFPLLMIIPVLLIDNALLGTLVTLAMLYPSFKLGFKIGDKVFKKFKTKPKEQEKSSI